MGAPATPSEIATPVPIKANRPNLLETGLSDYGMWIDIVAEMPDTPTTPGKRTGRIWA
jgi:cyanobactin cluster PatC/TenC/TruC protein